MGIRVGGGDGRGIGSEVAGAGPGGGVGVGIGVGHGAIGACHGAGSRSGMAARRRQRGRDAPRLPLVPGALKPLQGGQHGRRQLEVRRTLLFEGYPGAVLFLGLFCRSIRIFELQPWPQVWRMVATRARKARQGAER